jgi:hypothetical protein
MADIIRQEAAAEQTQKPSRIMMDGHFHRFDDLPSGSFLNHR